MLKAFLGWGLKDMLLEISISIITEISSEKNQKKHLSGFWLLGMITTANWYFCPFFWYWQLLHKHFQPVCYAKDVNHIQSLQLHVSSALDNQVQFSVNSSYYSPGSTIGTSIWSFSLVLKASAMILVASVCSGPLIEMPLTSRMNWPTISWPQLWAEPPFWQQEHEQKIGASKGGKIDWFRKMVPVSVSVQSSAFFC